MTKLFVLQRTAEDTKSTSGLLLDGNRTLCAILEPGKDTPEHPRIPAGEYDLSLRTFGLSHFDVSYREKFGEDYKGMIEIEVPGRQYIEVHTGNFFDQTRGCPMVGRRVVKSASRGAYEIPPGESMPVFWPAYQALLEAVKSEGGARLNVRDPPVKPTRTDLIS